MSRKFADWLARSARKVFSSSLAIDLGIDLALCLEPILNCVPWLPAATQIGGISSRADADFAIDVARFVRRWGARRAEPIIHRDERRVRATTCRRL